MPDGFSLIVNPTAGGGRAGRAVERLTRLCDDRGLDFEVAVSTGPDRPRELARAAVDRGRVAVACGGDGLVHAVADAVQGTGGTMGIVPLGSGNDVADHLGIGADLGAAVDLLSRGPRRLIDMVWTPRGHFIGTAAVGFAAVANAWANRRPYLPRPLVYPLSVLATLARYRPERFHLSIDGEQHDIEAWLIVVANCPGFGGGMQVAPRASATDGRLDIVIVGPISRPSFLATFPKVYRGTHVDNPAVRIHGASIVEIGNAADDATGMVFADGEPFGGLPMRAEVLPRAISVLAPAEEREGEASIKS